jgi:hypothetical protein
VLAVLDGSKFVVANDDYGFFGLFNSPYSVSHQVNMLSIR